MELALIDVRMLQYPSSVIAAAALCQTYKIIRMQNSGTDQGVENFIKERLGICGEEEEKVLSFCC